MSAKFFTITLPAGGGITQAEEYTMTDPLASEINTLTDLLDDIPADNLIERMSLMARLDNAKAALDSVPMQPNKVRLTLIHPDVTC